MDINAGKLPEMAYNTTQPVAVSQPEAVNNTSQSNIKTEKQDNQQAKDDSKLKREDLNNIATAMNSFMTNINANLHFAIHDKTQRLMVRVVDSKTSKILKEFPAHELLDTLAAIQDYVGVLLDKKA